MMMNLVVGVFVAFIVTTGMSAKTEPCTQKQESAQVQYICRRSDAALHML
jgi:hypothetical protein